MRERWEEGERGDVLITNRARQKQRERIKREGKRQTEQ